MSEFEGDHLVQIGVAGALTREMQADHAMFIQYLADALQRAFPNETELKLEGGIFTKKKLIGVSVKLGDDVYTLVKPSKGQLGASRTHVVRGIALKTESLPIDAWLEEISARIEERIGKDSNARSALASALGLG